MPHEALQSLSGRSRQDNNSAARISNSITGALREDSLPPNWIRSRLAIHIQSLDPDSGSGRLPRFNKNFSAQRYICNYKKILLKTEPNCGKMQCWRILQKISGSESRHEWLLKFNHRCISGKIIMKIQSAVITWNVKTQDKQKTNAT